MDTRGQVHGLQKSNHKHNENEDLRLNGGPLVFEMRQPSQQIQVHNDPDIIHSKIPNL